MKDGVFERERERFVNCREEITEKEKEEGRRRVEGLLGEKVVRGEEADSAASTKEILFPNLNS